MQVGGIQDPVFATLKGSDSQSIFQNLPTPAYVVEESQLIHNGKILASVLSAMATLSKRNRSKRTF